MKQQIYNITAADLYFNVSNENNTQLKTKRISISDFYLTPDEQKMKKVWQDEIHLTDSYYNSLIEHKRPIDFRIMVLLQANPRAMDLYLWMTYRAPWLKFPLKMTYAELHVLFGQGITQVYEFKRHFIKAIQEVHKVYPAINLEFTKKDYVTIYKSEPSVPKITNVGSPLFERH